MNLLPSKKFERVKTIAASSATLFIPSAGNLLSSMIVIRFMLPEWWGDIAVMQLYMYISVQICAWGNKDYLMLAYSKSPGMVPRLWQDSFSSRLFLLIPTFAFAFIISMDLFTIGILCLWIILRYIQQAFESIILFSRNFKLVMLAETIAIIITLSGLYMVRGNHAFHQIILIISLGYLIKTIIQLVYFRKLFQNTFSFKPDFKKLKKGLPFMMLGLAGVMLQKSDLMCFTWFEDKYHIAQYQVFSSFLILAQTFPGLIAGPFIKNLYRISPLSYPKIQWQFSLIGILVTICISVVTFIIITNIYHFNLPLINYVLGFVYVILTYFYIPEIYLLYKAEKQNQVMWISLFVIIFNILNCVLFIPAYSITGALLANVFSQILSLVLYKIFWRRSVVRPS
ncbi:MAG: hypothetical protein Q8M15_08385 [Bacteroidota bacterium]|nr:hypothetical protein [Bacteroidota bacterium]